MRILIISDIHGSAYYAKQIPEIFRKEKADKIILLGDLYYHGPRNPLPRDYDPMEVAKILNSLKDKIEVIRGNCDAEVDEMISEFKFQDYLLLEIRGLKVYFTHGHKYNMDKLPSENIDMMIYGHLHTGFITEENGVVFANPGSITLPKNNTKNSYIILDEEKIMLKDVGGNVIETKNI